MNRFCGIVFVWLTLAVAAPNPSIDAIDADTAFTGAVSRIPQRRAGLAVLVGAQATADIAALNSAMNYIVHVFEPDARLVEDLRTKLVGAGLYGSIAVTPWAGQKLPAADNIVNLLVVSRRSATQLELTEMARVVAPYGHIIIDAGVKTARKLSAKASQSGLRPVSVSGARDGIVCFVKNYPSGMDEWPQFRHDASLSSTSQDSFIGPATGVRWIQGELWTGGARRTVMILSARGRAFYLFAPWRFEAPADTLWQGFHIEARDAFNGQLLWQRRIGNVSELERPMAADGDVLYTRLSSDSGVAVLDAATGNVIRTLAGTGDICVHDGLVVTGPISGTWNVFDPSSGELVRKIESGSIKPPAEPRLFASSYNDAKLLLSDSSAFTLNTVGAGRVIRKEGLRSGTHAWETPCRENEFFHSAQRGKVFTLEYLSENRDTGKVHAYDAASGTHLWDYLYTRKKAGAGVFVSVFNRGDTVWTYARVPQNADGRYVSTMEEAAKDTAYPDGLRTNIGYVALDASSGKLLTNDLGAWKDFGRCGPDLATARYILGMDFNIYEPTGDGTSLTKVAGNFARGDCGFSYAPANGLRYNSDNNCACDQFIQGTIAVCSDSLPGMAAAWKKSRQILVKGPSFGFAGTADNAGGWPMYRCDALRSARCAVTVTPQPSKTWRADIGGGLSAPVTTGGVVIVAQPDAHRVHALDARNGNRLWSHTAGGRVSSVPSIYRGAVIFGAGDGTVQALRADNGSLIWRFAAAPLDRRIVVNGQLESLWPVHGTVLVNDGVAYALAGRHGDADEGMFLYAFDPTRGTELWREHIRGYADIRSDPRELDIYRLRSSDIRAHSVRSDLISTDGRTLFFSTLGIDLTSRRQVSQMPGRSLLTGQGTFLYDNSYPNPGVPGRFDWSIAGSDTGLSWRTVRGGEQLNPGATLVALSGDTMYGIRQSQYLHRWKDWNDKREGYLFAASLSQIVDPKTEKVPFWAVNRRVFWIATEKDNNPRFKALAVGANAVVVASQPGGGLLGGHTADTGEIIVFGKDGSVLSRTDIGAEPLFDGIALADGSIFVSTQAGSVVCLQ